MDDPDRSSYIFPCLGLPKQSAHAIDKRNDRLRESHELQQVPLYQDFFASRVGKDLIAIFLKQGAPALSGGFQCKGETERGWVGFMVDDSPVINLKPEASLFAIV